MGSDSLLTKVMRCFEFPTIQVRHEAVIFFTNLIDCVSDDRDYLSRLIFERNLFKHITEEIIAKDY